MKKDNIEYEDIRRMAEEATGREMKTPKDFDLLALRIYDRTRVLLSTSTLKRFWGYTDKSNEKRGDLRRSSLDALAQYVGFTSWDAFCKRTSKSGEEESSNLFYGSKQLTTKSLTPGDKLTVMWNPDRRIVIRYSGNDVFIVLASENSKLSVGDTFKCHVFVENQPLVLVDLVHGEHAPCGYICGKLGGIRFLDSELKN